MFILPSPNHRVETGAGEPARPPDPRLEAFAELVASVDRRDWKAGQIATKRLRSLGYSVCLVTPPTDRRSER
jgi:hypothetical protein